MSKNLKGKRALTQTVGRGKNLCLDRTIQAPAQGLRSASQDHRSLHLPRHDPHHAPSTCHMTTFSTCSKTLAKWVLLPIRPRFLHSPVAHGEPPPTYCSLVILGLRSTLTSMFRYGLSHNSPSRKLGEVHPKPPIQLPWAVLGMASLRLKL